MSSFVEKLRRLSTGDTSKSADQTVGSPRNNVWSSTFDPGRNQNMKKMGSSYYDKPIDNKTVWDQTLDSQKKGQAAPESPTVASNNSMGMDVGEIQRLAVKNSKNGVVDMDAFMKSLKSMQ